VNKPGLNSYLCIKGIIRRLWHEGMFKALVPRAFKFLRAIIDNYARGTYSAFFLTVAIGNCMVKLIPPANFCSDENIQTIFGTKLEDFLNYRIVYNSIS
jgi:hypothetical protein